MGRRRKSSGDTVSLFPFLSILACVIGILMLMIAAVALGQIGKDKVHADSASEQARQDRLASERVSQFKELQLQIEQDRWMMEDLEKRLAEFADIKQQLAASRADLTRLEEQRRADQQARSKDDQLAQHHAEVERLQNQIQQHQRESAALDGTLKKLKVELANRKKPAQEADVIIQPSGSGANLAPTFVECAASSAVLLEGPEPMRIPRGKLAQSAEFAELMARVRDQENGTLIFLIRPDGVSTYNTARSLARSNYVRNGKLAIASQGMIDLSRYRK